MSVYWQQLKLSGVKKKNCFIQVFSKTPNTKEKQQDGFELNHAKLNLIMVNNFLKFFSEFLKSKLKHLQHILDEQNKYARSK